MAPVSDKKKHADFQSSYRRSFNFNKSTKKNKFVLNDKGELVLREEATDLD